MSLNIAKEVATLEKLTVKQPRLKFAEVFGEPTNAANKAWLVKRIAWRLQTLAEGGLTERVRQRTAELTNDADLRTTMPKVIPIPQPEERTATRTLSFKKDDRLPPPGTVLTRKYKGQVRQVKVLKDGFEYEGEVYTSLSVRAI